MNSLLTTLDGVELFDCDNAWVIRNPVQYGKVEHLKILDNVFDLYKNKGYLLFAHEENANRFLQQLKKPIRMLEFRNPIPVVTPLGPAMAIYVTSSGAFEDDCWCVSLMEGGQVRHFISSDIKIWNNQTFGIAKPPTQNNP